MVTSSILPYFRSGISDETGGMKREKFSRKFNNYKAF
jgi:hypothetical protein